MKRAYGFTIVELLIVIVVIAILAAISVASYSGMSARTRDSQRAQDVQTIAKALELYYTDNGQYPVGSGSTAINSAWSTSYEASSWEYLYNQLAPYVESLPVDPINEDANTRYAYFSNTAKDNPQYCGVASQRQMYILSYRLESGEVSRVSVGDCSVKELVYGHSFHRVAK